jgi:murein DD-endopeptidase MepM/ murein hydrolase activator NlpD
MGRARWLPLLVLAASICPGGALAAPGRQPAPATQPAPASQPAPRSQKLKSGLHSPMPGGRLAGYHGDTGLDIAGRFLPVYALAAGTLDYAERGHTRWRGKRDTDWCVRLTLDQPIAYQGRKVTHLYYAHLSGVANVQPEGAPVKRRVAAGERLGTSGLANGTPHLHLGLILDGRVAQEYYADVLREWQVREVLGGYRNGALLPPLPRLPASDRSPTSRAARHPLP